MHEGNQIHAQTQNSSHHGAFGNSRGDSSHRKRVRYGRVKIIQELPSAFLLLYFAGMLGISMLSLHPALSVASFILAIVFRLYYFPLYKALSPLLWQLPLLFIVTCANPFFSASGATELFKIGSSAIYLESLCYGACSGLILLSSMLWFASAAQFLTSDKLMSMSSARFPQMSLMLSMVLRLIPKLEKRGKLLMRVARINKPQSVSGFKTYLAVSTQLMSWSLEDALETGDALKSKRWSPHIKRSSYRTRLLSQKDKIILLVGILQFVCALVLVIHTSQSFRFYPLMQGSNGLTALPFLVILGLIPLFYTASQERLWRSLN